jgi:hypothetical protein
MRLSPKAIAANGNALFHDVETLRPDIAKGILSAWLQRTERGYQEPVSYAPRNILLVTFRVGAELQPSGNPRNTTISVRIPNPAPEALILVRSPTSPCGFSSTAVNTLEARRLYDTRARASWPHSGPSRTAPPGTGVFDVGNTRHSWHLASWP